MGGCQNSGPFWGTLNILCRIILGIQKRDHNFDNHPRAQIHADKGLVNFCFVAWPCCQENETCAWIRS